MSVPSPSGASGVSPFDDVVGGFLDVDPDFIERQLKEKRKQRSCVTDLISTRPARSQDTATVEHIVLS